MADAARREESDGVWLEALPLDELWEGEMVGLRLGETDVLLINLGQDGVHAYHDRCPHAQSLLSEGRLRAATVQCAAHLWEFDARTGDSVNPRNCKLRRYPVKIVEGVVLVQTA